MYTRRGQSDNPAIYVLFNASSCVADKTAEEGGYCTEQLDVEPVQSPVYLDFRRSQAPEVEMDKQE
jgi:hypothetical protein